MPLTLSSDPFHLSRPASCWICGGSLSGVQSMQTEALCSERCRWRYRTLLPSQRCSVCGRPLTPGQMGARSCESPACRLEVGKVDRERARQRRLARERQLREIRDRKARELRRRSGAFPVLAPDAYPLAVIPSLRRAITELSEARRRAFEANLDRLMAELGERGAADEPADAAPSEAGPIDAPDPALEPLLGRACALCQGFCCRNGGEHAYLKVETLRRYMDAHPELGPREVLAAYLERVGTRTAEDSCVYHGAGGCTLPRDMRSDTCNRFFCPELRSVQTRWRQGEPARGFAVAMEGEAVVGATFIDETGSTPVTVDLEADEPPAPSA